MTNLDYTHYLFIMDHSGSIYRILDGMQAGYSEFVSARLPEPGKKTGSLWQFDTEIECVHSFAPLEALMPYQITPCGGTAMYDAIAQAVVSDGEKLAAMPENERPGSVIVIIASDGRENSSVEYQRDHGGGPRIAAMLQHQQDAYGWAVIYMGTNQDAFAESAEVGIKADSTLPYEGTNTRTRSAWGATDDAVRRYTRGVAFAAASGQSVNMSFSYTDADRAKAAGEKEDDSK